MAIWMPAKMRQFIFEQISRLIPATQAEAKIAYPISRILSKLIKAIPAQRKMTRIKNNNSALKLLIEYIILRAFKLFVAVRHNCNYFFLFYNSELALDPS